MSSHSCKDYSELAKHTNRGTDLWDILIGPVVTAATTTTVTATPVPASSLIPPPFLGSYSFPTGRQIAEVAINSSWSFPKDFHLGVAGAAFQIEGAAKDEGRGPSVWDKLVRSSFDVFFLSSLLHNEEPNVLVIHRSAYRDFHWTIRRAISRTTTIICTSRVSDDDSRIYKQIN